MTTTNTSLIMPSIPSRTLSSPPHGVPKSVPTVSNPNASSLNKASTASAIPLKIKTRRISDAATQIKLAAGKMSSSLKESAVAQSKIRRASGPAKPTLNAAKILAVAAAKIVSDAASKLSPIKCDPKPVKKRSAVGSTSSINKTAVTAPKPMPAVVRRAVVPRKAAVTAAVAAVPVRIPADVDTAAVRCTFEAFGRVQGVAFRRYTASEARKLTVRGWCGNTATGTVRGELEGPAVQVTLMQNWMRTRGSPKSRVDRVRFSSCTPIEWYSFADFEVRTSVAKASQ